MNDRDPAAYSRGLELLKTLLSAPLTRSGPHAEFATAAETEADIPGIVDKVKAITVVVREREAASRAAC